MFQALLFMREIVWHFDPTVSVKTNHLKLKYLQDTNSQTRVSKWVHMMRLCMSWQNRWSGIHAEWNQGMCAYCTSHVIATVSYMLQNSLRVSAPLLLTFICLNINTTSRTPVTHKHTYSSAIL